MLQGEIGHSRPRAQTEQSGEDSLLSAFIDMNGFRERNLGITVADHCL